MVASNFEACLSLVLVHEGTWADNEKDPGGATMKGVTLATYSDYLGRPATKAELRAIPDAHLEEIYRRGYWNTCRCDDLPAGVDYAVFDAAVNSGPGRSAQWLQRVVGAVVDGQIGPATIAATVRLPADKVVNALCDVRLGFMRVAKHAKTGRLLWPTFGKGWQRRMDAVRSHALAMIGD